MTQELQLNVLNTLIENIHLGRNESNEDRQHLPGEAIDNSTLDSLQAFLEIHSAISDILPSDGHYRTRFVERSSTNGVGIIYYTRPIGEGPKARGTEIQSLLLPTSANWRGCIESYLSGHVESPITVLTPYNQSVGNELRDRRPVFRIIGRPSRQLTRQIVTAFRISSLYSQIQPD